MCSAVLGAKPGGKSYRTDETDALSIAVTQVGLDLFALRVLALESEKLALVQLAHAKEEKLDEMRMLIKDLNGFQKMSAKGQAWSFTKVVLKILKRQFKNILGPFRGMIKNFKSKAQTFMRGCRDD